MLVLSLLGIRLEDRGASLFHLQEQLVHYYILQDTLMVLLVQL